MKFSSEGNGLRCQSFFFFHHGRVAGGGKNEWVLVEMSLELSVFCVFIYQEVIIAR